MTYMVVLETAASMSTTTYRKLQITGIQTGRKQAVNYVSSLHHVDPAFGQLEQ